MRRRAFIAALGGAAAWPLAARAQQPALPVIGYISGGSSSTFMPLVTPFRQGLKEVGFVEGQNMAIEFRWAETRYERIPTFVAELAARHVAVIAATAGAYERDVDFKAGAGGIPIVFLTAGDPVKRGQVASLSRPGGNVTGLSLLLTALGPKRLELLHEVVPDATVIGMIVNPNVPDFETELGDVQAATGSLGLEVLVFKASDDNEIEKAFTTMVAQKCRAVLLGTDPFFLSRRQRFFELAAHYSLPAIYPLRVYAMDGGLMSYGTNIADAYRRVGIYVGQILKGANPTDLPVQQSTLVELTLNLKTAKSLGLTLPLSLLGRADEVIE